MAFAFFRMKAVKMQNVGDLLQRAENRAKLRDRMRH